MQKYEKKLLDETGTQTRNSWVPPKPNNLCTKKWQIGSSFANKKFLGSVRDSCTSASHILPPGQETRMEL